MKYIALISLLICSCINNDENSNMFMQLNNSNPNITNIHNTQVPDVFAEKLPKIHAMVLENKITYNELEIVVSFLDRYEKLESFEENASQYNKTLFNDILKCLIEKHYDKVEWLLNDKKENFKKVISKKFNYDSEYMYPIFEVILNNYIKNLYAKNDYVNLKIFDVTISLYAFHLNNVQFGINNTKIQSIFYKEIINKETIENYVNKYITNPVHKYAIKNYISTKKKKNEDENLVYNKFYEENLIKWFNSYQGLDKICRISREYLLNNISKKDFEFNTQQVSRFNEVFRNCVSNGIMINVKKVAKDGIVLSDSQYSFGEFLCLFLLTKCQRDHTSNKIIGDNFVTNIFKSPLHKDVKQYCVESLEKYDHVDKEIFTKLSNESYDLGKAKEVVATIKDQMDKLW